MNGGAQTIAYSTQPRIAAAASIAGPMEGKGPLGETFDQVMTDTLLGQKSWELAEASMLRQACHTAIGKAQLRPENIELLLAGDLLNQLMSASICARELSLPYLGLFGACSTLIEGIVIASAFVDSGFVSTAVCAASSHHDTAERQPRYPTEFATQRAPTAQWTVTGAGAVVLTKDGAGPVVTHATIGKVVDMGLGDTNDMGSAMAAATAETIWRHLEDTKRTVDDYDLIISGDLGKQGSAVCRELLGRSGIDPGKRLQDCGMMIYSANQDVHAGGSGCACCALVFAGKFYPELTSGRLRRLLLVGTGALFSPTSHQQGETIPCIAHAIALEART